MIAALILLHIVWGSAPFRIPHWIWKTQKHQLVPTEVPLFVCCSGLLSMLFAPTTLLQQIRTYTPLNRAVCMDANVGQDNNSFKTTISSYKRWIVGTRLPSVGVDYVKVYITPLIPHQSHVIGPSNLVLFKEVKKDLRHFHKSDSIVVSTHLRQTLTV